MKASNFKLFSQAKKEVSLEDYLGNHLIINFFPQAFSSSCTEQLCHMRDNLKQYQNLGTAVIGISVDSPFTLAAFATQNNYTFPLLSDFNKEIAKAYNVYLEDFVFGMKGVSKRAVFLVDSHGDIVYQEVTASPGDLPNFDRLKQAINKL